MKILVLFILLSSLLLSDTLKFGVISTVDVQIMEKKMQPLIDYLEKKVGHTVVFHTGRDYEDTINKFSDNTYDFGYIGPAPYVLATSKKKNLKILAGLETNNEKTFSSAIIVKKDSNIRSIKQLADKTIAFGSPSSTLSYYVPKYILIKEGMASKISDEYFLGAHDRVAEYVIMGRYDAGGVKKSVAKMYEKYIDVIKVSEPIYDFCIVANTNLDSKIQTDIQKALLELKDKQILSSIKQGATGFGFREDSDYDNLRSIMKEVQEYSSN